MLGNFHIPNGPALLHAAGGNLAVLADAIEEIRRNQWFPTQIKPKDIEKAIKKLQESSQPKAA